MYSKLPQKTSSRSPFKLALNNSSSSPSSCLPTSTTSRIPSASSKGKENVAPFSRTKVSKCAPAKSVVADKHDIKDGAKLGDIKYARSIAKDCDENWETGLETAKISTPKRKNINRFSQGNLDKSILSCAESLSDISPLANRHNDSIEITRKRSLARLSLDDKNEADISLDAVPDSLTAEGILQYIEPIEDFGDDEVANETFDLSDMLNKLDAPEERLMDGSLSELMNVEINYSLEFPNTAIGRPPHISVCQFKRDKKRAAQRAAQRDLDNLVQNSCIIDIPLQDLAPSLKWKALRPEQYKVPVQNIPSLIVTSPSDGNLVSAMEENMVTVDFDPETIASGSYRNFLLDASFYNWTIRFGEVLPIEVEQEVAISSEETPAIPEIIVTSPSDGDLYFGGNAEEDLNETY